MNSGRRRKYVCLFWGFALLLSTPQQAQATSWDADRFLAAGSGVLGGAYAMTLAWGLPIAGAGPKSGRPHWAWMLLPAAGPASMYGHVQDCSNAKEGFCDMGNVFLVGLGSLFLLAQTVGFVFLAIGIAKKLQRKPPAPKAHPRPTPPRPRATTQLWTSP